MRAGGIPFFTDNMVPESAGDYLQSLGHGLTRLRQVMVPNTKDPVIAFACSQAGHVLVTHDKDFRDVATRLGITQRQYRTRLHRIPMRCPEPKDVARLTEAMSLIEAEWALVTGNRPMSIEVFDVNIRVWR